MKVFIKTFIAVFVLLIAQNVFAVKQVDIFTQSILVEKNANATRISSVRKQAMLQVLQSASLIQNIDKIALIRVGLLKHKQYIASEKVNRSDEVFISVIGQEIPMIELEIQFDSKKINQLLLQAKVSTLDAKRPETIMIVMVQHKDGSTNILSRKDLYVEAGLDVPFYESITQQFEKEANTLQLPIVWPMMDSQDLYFFDQSDFWQVDKNSIINFAKRYSVQVILIARIKEHDDGRFIGEWNVLDLGQPKVQYYDSLTEFTGAGLKQLAQSVMQQYGINPNDKKDERVLIRMNQIKSITEFHQNEVFFNRISGVESVNALNVNGFEVTYLLQLGVSQKQFLSSLKLNDNIEFLIEDELRRPLMIDVIINDFE
ncbi:MAG: DUF2066 domain-containing protein [Saccharospirillaceae bacterium]|nr:DUF2066 domain-containing protein [Pseudomonadales bacterium]NRB78220.1 DUF2066 domain-containing protein [Saccharospirillaceae bacterium]